MGWAGIKPRGNVISSFEGSVGGYYESPSREWQSLSIKNDSIFTTLRFEVNGIEIKVKAGEEFDDDFEGFNRIDILNNVAHRLTLRG